MTPAPQPVDVVFTQLNEEQWRAITYEAGPEGRQFIQHHEWHDTRQQALLDVVSALGQDPALNWHLERSRLQVDSVHPTELPVELRHGDRLEFRATTP